MRSRYFTGLRGAVTFGTADPTSVGLATSPHYANFTYYSSISQYRPKPYLHGVQGWHIQLVFILQVTLY